MWGLASAHLGSGLRWSELFDLNRGRTQPGGGSLVDPNLIYPGWTLVFPSDATGVAPSGSSDIPPMATAEETDMTLLPTVGWGSPPTVPGTGSK